MRETRCQLLVIGAGPGGYVCAVRAAQLGLDVIVVDQAPPGGTCLNIGCIPSKALIHAADEFARARSFAADNPFGIRAGPASIDLARAVAWKDGIVARLNAGVAGLLQRSGAKHLSGRARIVDGKTVELDGRDGERRRLRAEHLVVATGSAPAGLDALPFGGPVISSSEALALDAVPDRLVVVGAGYIGLELGTAFAKLGAAVSVVESEARLLPQYDAELVRPVAKRLTELGVQTHTGARAEALSEDSGALRIRDADGGERTLAADKILLTVGRRPRVKGFGLEQLELDMDRGAIVIDGACRSSMRGVYAIGDVTGEPMLAHRAMAQGELLAEYLAGRNRRWDKVAIPAVCYTDPEIVSAGLTPDAARAQGYEIKTGKFPFAASGRALSIGREDGFVRVVARADNHVLLGLQAVGAAVGELAADFTLALEMGARLEDLADTVHAHPTLGEAVREAALAASGAALHV